MKLVYSMVIKNCIYNIHKIEKSIAVFLCDKSSLLSFVDICFNS